MTRREDPSPGGHSSMAIWERLARLLIPRWIRRSIRHAETAEARYLRGERLSRSRRKSVLFFTLHKCASVFLRDKLHALAREIGLAPLDMDSHFFVLGRTEPIVHEPRGYFYGPYRSPDSAYGQPRSWPDLRDYQVLLVVRDPRDVLTSLYYSSAFSHAVPEGPFRESLLRHRQQTLRQTIDEFVRDQAPAFAARYEAYVRMTAATEVHVARYEELVTDPHRWLDGVLTYLHARVPPRFARSLIRPRDFRVKHEDPRAHVRQIAPGDHARKLRPETIEWLNRQFESVLAAFGYHATSSAVTLRHSA